MRGKLYKMVVSLMVGECFKILLCCASAHARQLSQLLQDMQKVCNVICELYKNLIYTENLFVYGNFNYVIKNCGLYLSLHLTKQNR